MGVPRLVKIILEKYPKCHQHVNGQKIQYFFMDFNPIIYTCYRDFSRINKSKIQQMSQTTIEAGIIEQVIKKTKHMICDVVQPQKLVYIAIDGPAPRGKMIQQRHRRYRKVLETRYKQELKTKHSIYETEPWDTSNITPGTKFMEKLSQALRHASRAGTFSTHYSIDVIISDGNVPGEGEHKFLPFIEGIKTSTSTSSQDENDREKFCIFSNDGDLLVLGNRFAKDKDIYILTEPNPTSSVVKKQYTNEEFMYILLKEFQDGFVEELELTNFDRDRVVYDYIFFTFFGGNDFVKHFPYTMMKEFNTFNLLKRIYKMLLEEHGDYLISFRLVQGRDKPMPYINTKFFKDFVTELAKREEMGLKNKQKRYNDPNPGKDEYKPPPSMPEWEKEFIKLQNNYYFKEDHPHYQEVGHLFKKINYDDVKDNWKKRYYQHFFDIDEVITNNSFAFKQQRTIISLQYVKSLIYTLYYYLDEIPSWTWYYPYRMAPLPSDVQSALHSIDDINTIFQFDLGQPFNPFDQLMLVLPPQNTILPNQYRELMRTQQLKEFYPTEFELDVLQGEKFIYSEPLLPEIDVSKLLTITQVEAEKLSKADQKRNTVKNSIIYIPKKKETHDIHENHEKHKIN